MLHIAELKERLLSPRKIVVTAHQKPDADALGSSLAAKIYLEALGHQVQVIMPTDYPEFLNWMPGNDSVLIFEPEKNEAKVRELLQEADLFLCLDFSDLRRISPMDKLVEGIKAEIAMIDHHIDRKDFAHFEYWDPEAAATAELLFNLICESGHKHLISKAAGECLFAGIMTDTGSFKHSNTSANVHRVTAELIDLGVNTSDIQNKIYDDNSLDRMRLLGYALSEKLQVLPEFRTAYISLSKEELKRFNFRTGDTEGVVNYALGIRGIHLAAIFIEKPEAIRMSFRSEGKIPANEIAGKHFEGGGHRNAAGGRSKLSLEATVEKFLGILPDYADILLS